MTDIEQMLQDMKSAKEEPSEHCAEGDMHDFQFMMHADGSNSFSNYYRCPNCREIIVRTQKRTGLDKVFWEAED
jgi:hypothetical protein